MSILFTPDSFTCVELSAAVNNIPAVPGLLGNWFETDSMRTTSAYIDIENSKLKLVSDSARGSVGSAAGQNSRSCVVIPACHLVQVDAVYPQDVQDVRAFGSNETETVIDRLVKKQAVMRRNIEATLEWQRVGAVKGQILDADGQTVLHDLFADFNVNKTPDVNLTWPTAIVGKNNPVIEAVETAYYAVEDAMGAMPFDGVHAICGRTFWTNLISNPYVREAYNMWLSRQDALGGDAFMERGFTYGGITWHRYNRTVAGNTLVDTAKAHVFPVGSGILKQIYAPADYMETVNTDGLPFYSRMAEKPMNKGWDLEVQSNPVTICTMPQALVTIIGA